DIAGQTGTSYSVSNAVAGANYYRIRFTSGVCSEVYSNVITIYYKDCTIIKGTPQDTTAGAQRIPFEVIAYPNPSDNYFNFDVRGAGTGNITLLIYDMAGKLVEQQELAPEAFKAEQVGQRYPSGVYNVIVMQDDKTKSLRIIKK
uniref:T9SS type A sorting domain-containing protein n=1 Tax=Flavobacterium sp. TaxID=239 RepID=UPI00260E2E1C